MIFQPIGFVPLFAPSSTSFADFETLETKRIILKLSEDRTLTISWPGDQSNQPLLPLPNAAPDSSIDWNGILFQARVVETLYTVLVSFAPPPSTNSWLDRIQLKPSKKLIYCCRLPIYDQIKFCDYFWLISIFRSLAKREKRTQFESHRVHKSKMSIWNDKRKRRFIAWR